jgi:hypothetical protein
MGLPLCAFQIQGRPTKRDFAIFLQFHVTNPYTAGKMLSTHQSSTQQLSTHQIARSTVSRILPLWIIFFVWVASNLLLLALQALGLGVGFNVHPLGEDREFTRLMANYPGLEFHHQFWTTLQDVVLLEFDGQKVTRLTRIDQQTFSGYGALYAREKPFAAGF